VYRAALDPDANTLEIDLQVAISLECELHLQQLPDNVELFCTKVFASLQNPLVLLPGPNLQTFDGSLPEWIIGDDPFASDSESPTYVLHTSSPRFIAAIFEGVDTFSAHPKHIDFWDDKPSQPEVKAWAEKAMTARDRFYDRWEEWNAIHQRIVPSALKSIH
jgi:hypothetical protein